MTKERIDAIEKYLTQILSGQSIALAMLQELLYEIEDEEDMNRMLKSCSEIISAVAPYKKDGESYTKTLRRLTRLYVPKPPIHPSKARHR